MDNLTDNQKITLLSIVEAAFMNLDKEAFQKDVQECMDKNKAGAITNMKAADLVDRVRAISPRPENSNKPKLRLV